MSTLYFKSGQREVKPFFCVNPGSFILFHQELATLKPHSLQNAVSNYITLVQTSYIKRISCEKEVTTLPSHTQRILPDIKDGEYKLFSFDLCKPKTQVSSTVNIILWSSGLQTSRELNKMLDIPLHYVLIICAVTSDTLLWQINKSGLLEQSRNYHYTFSLHN